MSVNLRLYIALGYLLLIIGGAIESMAQKPDTCQADLGMARQQMGNYQNDYVRKVNELSQTQLQLGAAQQKIKMLEELVKKHETDAAAGGAK